MRAGEAARAYWSRPTPETRAPYFDICLPLYNARSQIGPADWKQRVIMRNETGVHFNGPANEQGRMDFRDALGKIDCPVLVMGGEEDPIMPIAFSETIAASLPPELVRFERFPRCGHAIVPDDPDGALRTIRDFIMS